MTHKTLLFAGLGLLASTASCGGGAATTETTESTAHGHTHEAPEGEIPSPPTPWADMSFNERKSWMGHEVSPRMGELFEGHDAERFAGFGCEGCRFRPCLPMGCSSSGKRRHDGTCRRTATAPE